MTETSKSIGCLALLGIAVVAALKGSPIIGLAIAAGGLEVDRSFTYD